MGRERDRERERERERDKVKERGEAVLDLSHIRVVCKQL
jgi:hypothetical protein